MTQPIPAEQPRDGPSGEIRRAIEPPHHARHLGMVVAADGGSIAANGQAREPAAPTISWPTRAHSGGDPPAEGDDRAGRIGFGKYELLGELGRGGMGVVYKARQLDLDRLVALKMILASHVASPEQVARFYAEARAAAKLRSPNIVAIHEVGQTFGQHYFAMEYIAGPSLSRLLEQRRGPLEPMEAARIVLTVARAVGLLHRQGIVHRDLKPSNVLLDDQGNPHVSDFGLAKMLSGDDGATGTGAIVGTPSYMAPEQAAGRHADVGPLTDIYALGAILYELLTGRPPFRQENPLDTLVQVIEGEARPPAQLRPEIPAALEAICLKCLSKPRGDRYASADALADDLERFLKGEQVEARRANLARRIRTMARREPALACRLGTMALCGLIVIADITVLSRPRYDPSAVRKTLAIALTWALASILCRAALRRERWKDLPRFAWAAADVAFFTALVYFNEGLATALVAGYFLLVAASGLWFRDHLVWFTTGTAVIAYGLLVLIESLQTREVPESPYAHFVFAAALAVTGLVIAYQVKRVRALSLYYEHRPLE
ncbi:MAG: serine/threonine-protein kinase [Isosphaeraceae bacterium]